MTASTHPKKNGSTALTVAIAQIPAWILRHEHGKKKRQLAASALSSFYPSPRRTGGGSDTYDFTCFNRVSASDVCRPPSLSMFNCLTTPSSSKAEKRLERTPRPLDVRSNSRPNALVQTALPSASKRTLPLTFRDLPQAPITKGSFTATHQISSTPAALNSSALAIKPGKCCSEQVGVKAPGTANTAIFLPLTRSATWKLLGPIGQLSVAVSMYSLRVASGTRAPTEMDIRSPYE